MTFNDNNSTGFRWLEISSLFCNFVDIFIVVFLKIRTVGVAIVGMGYAPKPFLFPPPPQKKREIELNFPLFEFVIHFK